MRSRGARLKTHINHSQLKCISTHALTRSATEPIVHYLYHVNISTHALTRSATYNKNKTTTTNPISTHALTRSATIAASNIAVLPYHFNSRAHVERDPTLRAPHRARTSISTHALTWSATPTSPPILRDWLYFNSRAHVERDSRKAL